MGGGSCRGGVDHSGVDSENVMGWGGSCRGGEWVIV